MEKDYLRADVGIRPYASDWEHLWRMTYYEGMSSRAQPRDPFQKENGFFDFATLRSE
jgi:hypothetical protein